LQNGRSANLQTNSYWRVEKRRPNTAQVHAGAIMSLPVPVITIGLLFASNVFMTFAWYGHLKFKAAPLITVILLSWGIAFFEYLLQVPANRIGHGTFSAAQLKTIQEVITLTVFAIFSVYYLDEPIRWNHMVGFAFIATGAWFVFAQFGGSQ
jgi:uncharacterized protein (DUF486 family)